MAKKQKSPLLYVGAAVLIAVIAIGVLVVLFRPAPSSEEALAGEAFRIGGRSVVRGTLSCQSFLNPLGENNELASKGYDTVCRELQYEQCVGVMYTGSSEPEPLSPEEKITKTITVPGTCERSFTEERMSIASAFGISSEDFSLSVYLNCCRVK